MNPGWLNDIEGNVLKVIAENTINNNVLEIGSLYGKSTEYIVQGLRIRHENDFKVYCIDPWWYIDDKRDHPGKLFYDRAYKQGYDGNIIHLKVMSREVASFIMERAYGFCFIDGDHATLPTIFDMLICSTVTEIMLVHDYNSNTHQEVNEAVNWFIKVSGWEIVDTKGSIAVLKGKKTLRRVAYHNVKVPE